MKGRCTIASIGTLSVAIKASSAGLEVGLQAATKRLHSFAGGIKSIFGGTFGALVGFDLLQRGVGALKDFTVEAFNSIDKLNDLSMRLGASTEFLSGLEHAAKLSGSSLEDMETALSVLSRKLGSTGPDAKAFAEDLARMGLNLETLKQGGFENAFLTIAERISELASAQEQASAAFNVFSKGGNKVLQVLQEGRGGFRAFAEDAKRLGLSFSGFDAAKVAKANDAMDRLKGALAGIGRGLAIEFAPLVERVANGFADLGVNGRSMGRTIVNALEQVTLAAAGVADSIGGIEGAFLRLRVAGLSIQVGFQGAGSIMETLLGPSAAMVGFKGSSAAFDATGIELTKLLERIRQLENTGARQKGLKTFFDSLRAGDSAAQLTVFGGAARALAGDLSGLTGILGFFNPELRRTRRALEAFAGMEGKAAGIKPVEIGELKAPGAVGRDTQEALSIIARHERQGLAGRGDVEEKQRQELARANEALRRQELLQRQILDAIRSAGIAVVGF